MKPLPLIRFFVRRRPDRLQLAFLFLFLYGVVHLSFFSLAGRDPWEARAWMLSTWFPLLAPVWFADPEMNRRGAVRLFVWPGARLARVIASYLVARCVRAAVFAVVIAIVALNTHVGIVGAAELARVALACAVLGVFSASVVSFWNVVAGGRVAALASYAAFVVLLWLFSRLGNNAAPREAFQFVFMPIWLLDPVGAAREVAAAPWRILQACTATLTWVAATWFVLRRSYR